ncbi:fragment of putative ATPase, AAA family (part 1) [Bradyrhizobium sp. ORS 375]|nr:fragment of putative ATPase, AAA family (part 1) [Bradyrhizobium sp. ORS 375]
MKLQIDRPAIEAMAAAFPHLAALKEQLRFGDKVEVNLAQLAAVELDSLRDFYQQAGPEWHARAAHIATLQRAFSDSGTRFSEHELEQVLPAIARYLISGAIRGWMFTANVASRPLPYVVTRLDYTAPSNDESGRVFIELKANAKGAITTSTLRISAGDIVGRTVAEIFAAKGFLKETPELIAAYDETAERYFAWRGRYGAQFSGRGIGFFADDPNASHRDMD